MDRDDDGVALHMLAVYCRRCAADGEFSGFLRFEDKGKTLVLGHIPVYDTHSAGLDRSLGDAEPMEIGRRHIVYLFCILDDELHLQVFSFADILAADDGGKFHLAEDTKSRNRGYQQEERKA